MNSNFWMILPAHAAELRAALDRELPDAAARAKPRAAETLDVVDGVARIPIVGFLARDRSALLDFFEVPQTSYLDIRAAVREADADESVRAIQFEVDSPGGEASNDLIETANAIFETSKPSVAVVGEMAASAAYWLASQADRIALSGPATFVGSIGVAVDMSVGGDVVSIASTNAPRKRPDATTEEGKSDIRMALDDLHELFVADVARGRGVSAATINSDFGKGDVVIASKAVAAGMADKIIRPSIALDNRANLAAMDLDTLRTAHAELYAQVVAIGVSKERSSVSAHLKLAEASGATSVAIEHIKAGSCPMDPVVQAEHQAAVLKELKQAARVNDNAPDLNAKAPVPDTGPSERDEAIRDMFASDLGVDIKC